MKFSQPNFGAAEIKAVAYALEHGHLATGAMTEKFEEAIKKKYGYPHVVAVNSGTSALYLALLAMDVGPGDEVIVPAYGIMCTVNAIIQTGATPVFCDIDRHTYNIDPVEMQKKITSKIKVVLPVSLFGVPCDVVGIEAHLPKGVKVLEDSIECLGSTRRGKAIGMDVDAATFGFYPNKQITTGQGGVVVTCNALIADRVRRLRQHGYGPGDDLWTPGYGFNMRLPDMNAAFGIVQLQRLEWMQALLRGVKAQLDEFFGMYRMQQKLPGDHATEFIYGIELPLGVNKRDFCRKMEEQGVPVRPYFNALHHEPHVRKYTSKCSVADVVGGKTVALPFHYELTTHEMYQIFAASRKAGL